MDLRRAPPNSLCDERDCTPVKSISGAHLAHFHPVKRAHWRLSWRQRLRALPVQSLRPRLLSRFMVSRCFCSELWVCTPQCFVKRNGCPFLDRSSMGFYRAISSISIYIYVYSIRSFYRSPASTRCASRGLLRLWESSAVSAWERHHCARNMLELI